MYSSSHYLAVHPPELQQGTTIRGRWGGWGADFHATNFDEQNPLQFQQGRTARLFTFGPPLQKYLPKGKEAEWSLSDGTTLAGREIELSQYGSTLFAIKYGSAGEQLAFSFDKKVVVADLQQGEWSEWIPITLQWKVGIESKPIVTQFKIRVIKLDDDGFFRIRLFYNNLNEYLTEPPAAAADLVENVGPMVDFVDNFPPQLIFYPEDKEVFLEELDMSFDWHTRAASHILSTYDPDIYIHNIYSPNQMLTSRWWMGYIDPQSSRYDDVTEAEREKLWEEVQGMYLKLDGLIGEMLDAADENTFVVLSSDHGANPLDKWVHLNNLFAQKGWLHYEFDPLSGEPIIDWENSTVIYLKMDNVYIDPDGLGGDYFRSSGEAYDRLRDDVMVALEELTDVEEGEKPVVKIVKWEDASFLDLPQDRVGDLIIVNQAGYGWNEEPTEGGELFSTPLKTGYKQAILPDETQAMWTPFIIVGPGIKKGYMLDNPIHHQDQYPTIMKLMGIAAPIQSDGDVIASILSQD